MEMQADLDSASDSSCTRGDNLDFGQAWQVCKASLLLSVEESSCGSSDAASATLDLPLELQCDGKECSQAASKASIYCRQSSSAEAGVYVPTSANYHLHYKANDLGLPSFDHYKDSRSLKDKEENFIILIDSSDNENLPPMSYKGKKRRKSLQEHGQLQELKKSHMPEHSFWCSICGKEFSRAANLRMHKLIHSSDRPHKCPECDKGFIRTADVWRHLCRTHKIERSSVVLESANVKNPWSVLQQNQDDHSDSRQLDSAVKDCGKESSKQYLCPICNKGFSKPNLLSKHKVIHKQEKLYKCKECDKAFIQPSRLKRHSQIHTGERPFHCEECGRSYTRIFTLQRHMRGHTGEKPYVCVCCHQSFSELGTLKKHEQVHKVIQS